MIVLAPSSVQELFDYTVRAFNLAEQYRNPVIVASETTIALMRERLEIPHASKIPIVNRKYTNLSPDKFLPYDAPENGVPDAAPLGRGYHGLYTINPHDIDGSIEWDPIVYDKLYKRITGKITANEHLISHTESFQLDDADIALVAYGKNHIRSPLQRHLSGCRLPLNE